MSTQQLKHSALFKGRIAHRRHETREHRFSNRIALLYVDLDELAALERLPLLSVNRFGVFRWDRGDYLGDPATPLDEAVRARAAEELGRTPRGPVRMLTMLRTFGYVFNPVSFYYLFDEAGALDAIVAEITNTPWKERHSYVLDAREGGPSAEVRRRFAKAFHVSPFFAMDHTYAWRFGVPGERLWVQMQNTRDDELLFEAHLTLERRPLTARSFLGAQLAYPLMPFVGILAIHWQALRLWLKRVPALDHPNKHGAPRPVGR